MTEFKRKFFDVWCNTTVIGEGSDRKCYCPGCGKTRRCPGGKFVGLCKAKEGTQEWLEYIKYDKEYKEKMAERAAEIHKVAPKIAEALGYGDEKLKKKPGLMVRIANFAKAFKKWEEAGFPKRTEEEVEELYETKCKKCVMFVEESQVCGHAKCGCNLSPKAEFLNKLTWATEHCPKDPPEF